MATIRKRGSKFQVQVRRAGFQSATKSFERLTEAKACSSADITVIFCYHLLHALHGVLVSAVFYVTILAMRVGLMNRGIESSVHCRTYF